MLQKFFRIPFAQSGDKVVIPDATQPDGSVSFTQGYTFDYERDLSYDPDAKPIEREEFNFAMNAVTTAIQQYQVFGTPEFITTADNGGVAYSYEKGARVRYTGDGGTTWAVYESLEAGNQDTPPSSKWQKKTAWSALLTGAGPWWFWHESGFIIQCGTQNAINAISSRTFDLPVAVDAHFGGVVNVLQSQPSFTMNFTALSTTQARIYNGSGSERSGFWVSLGYKAQS